MLPLAILVVALAILIASFSYRWKQLARLKQSASWTTILRNHVSSPVFDDAVAGGIIALEAYEHLPAAAELVTEVLSQLPEGTDAALGAVAEGGIFEGAGEGVADGFLLGLAYRAVRNGGRVAEGLINVRTAIQDTITDSVLATGGAIAGSAIVGFLAGLLSAPLTGGASLLLALLGSGGGAIAGGRIARWWKSRAYRKAVESWEAAKSYHNEALTSFARTYLVVGITIFDRLKKAHKNQLKSHSHNIRVSGPFLRRILFPSDNTRIRIEQRKEAKRVFRTETVPHFQRLCKEVKKYLAANGAQAGSLLYAQGDAVLVALPRLLQQRQLVDDAWDFVLKRLQVVEFEVQKLNARLR